MPQDDGSDLKTLERMMTHFETMMRKAKILKEKAGNEFAFWTIKRMNWMRRLLVMFDHVWQELKARYERHSVFVPDIPLLKLWGRAEALAPVIGDFAMKYDMAFYALEAPVPASDFKQRAGNLLPVGSLQVHVH